MARGSTTGSTPTRWPGSPPCSPLKPQPRHDPGARDRRTRGDGGRDAVVDAGSVPGPVLDHAAAHLADKHTHVFDAETARELVHDSYARVAVTARIHIYLPTLATRLADDRLRAVAKIEGAVMSTPEVLFVCVHNAGRSQMAAALFDHHAAGKVTVRSAGSTPATEINPVVIGAMAEIGLDLSKEFPKPLTDEAVRAADVVITMGCGDACPIYPGKRYLDWDLADPAGQDLDTVRGIRDQIDTLVQRLLAELAPTRAPS